ncbi:uncharacterized protein BDZ99DRAFT_440085 [Mytilinidion resinicola]|uniref:BTB domain-containing protein n=1 Tax=Mytilinidion resinicola TaxID=574789 RepID=A0A6A6YUZ1_9PEZI|nr:uncharacterized protein BDZ99DRAFT_440085 [Mytilinidion resinicola]KAF2812752.1 hypothetical protein BDZ99DRAFT_440085 [Mytilinidion resinicola]
MVSYPDSAHGGDAISRTLALRNAPSVASSRASHSGSTVRRHRGHRSHFGGSSYAPQNEFPVFTHTGDVEIVVKAERGGKEQRYLLHRLILAQCSGFFEAGTSEEWSRAQEDGNANGGGTLARIPEQSGSGGVGSQGKKRWRYELDWGQGEDDIPMLVQKDPNTSLFGGSTTAAPPPARNKPSTPSTGFFRSMANFSALNLPSSSADQEPIDETLRDYDNLFRVFYNYPPALDPINIANAYVECKTLLHLADMYDALDVIGPRVDHHLLRFQGRLFKQIAKYPPSYLKLGYLARSKVIFSEALTHVVGQWPAGLPQLRNQTPAAVLELIEDKVDELDELKQRIEGKLFRLTLTTSRGERVNPGNGWLDWLAMSLFRQWVAENTTPPPAPILKSPPTNGGHSRSGSRQPQQATPAAINTGHIFRLLGTGGNAYLPRDELKRFLKSTPGLSYDRDTVRRFERSVEELKHLARDCVKPLMRNFLELDLGREGGGGLPYLTCTKVEERDFPWDE